MAQIIVAGVLALLLTAGQISAERRMGTFDVLRTTPIHGVEILVGKALASVGYVILLALAAVPVYSVCLMLGGVAWIEILLTFYLTLLTCVTYAVIGVASSAPPLGKRMEDRRGGFGTAFILNGGLALGLYYFFAYVVKMSPSDSEMVGLMTFYTLSPPAMFHAFTHAPVEITGTFLNTWLLPLHTFAQLAVIAFFIWWGCRGIASEATLPVVADDRPTIPGQPSVKGLRFLRLFPISDHLNPVAAKDILLALPKGRVERWLLGFVGLAMFGIGVWSIVESRFSLEWTSEAMHAYDWISLFGVMLLAIAVFLRASSVIVSESDGGTLGSLAATPLRPSRTIAGKLLAVVVSSTGAFSALYVGLTAVFCLVYPAYAQHALRMMPLVLVAVAASSATFGALGLCISAGAPTVRAASNRAAIGLVIVLFLGGPMLGAFAGATGESGALIAFSLVFPATMIVLPGTVLAEPLGWARWLLPPLGLAMLSVGTAMMLGLATDSYRRRLRSDALR
jgi:hypothetical protein